MTCHELEPMLALHAGGDLSPREADQVRRHVRTCDACARTLEDLAASVRWVSQHPTPDPGAAAYARMRRSVRNRLEREGHGLRESWVLRWLGIRSGSHPRPALAGAGLLVVAGFVAVSFAFLRTPVPPVGLAFAPAAAVDARAPLTPALSEPTRNVTALLASAEGASSRDDLLALAGVATTDGAEATDDPGLPLLAQAPTLGEENLDDTTESGRLRIELSTPDPNVRIIWFGERLASADEK